MMSGITYYYIEDITIECVITDDNIQIKNSYQVTSDEDKVNIINDLLESFPWFKESRTCEDMLHEWRAHNYLYNIKFKTSHTKDVDFELKQKIIKRFLYWLISKLVRKDV